MIPQQTVQEIMETAKIEEVIGDFINLKRRGVNLIGLCPFHGEKTPSFTVSPTKNIYKCFGCGKGGNAAQFIMEHEQYTFPEALRYLAQKYGIELAEQEISQEARESFQLQDSLFIINQFAAHFFENQLINTEKGKHIGLSYFQERGFREHTIKKFNLGFAPEQYDALTKVAQQNGYNIDLLRKLGLTTNNDRDFFRDRVMFTIHNLSGKPIAFAGRTLQKDKKVPKYINSPETEIYVKNKVLYGIHLAKQAIRKADECILVEGYTDVISLHQAGIENVVASSGTSLTIGQIQLIKRYTPNIKILYDGDSAGINAALRGLDLILEQDMNVKVVLLPPSEDPDSYVQKVGSTGFENYIDQQAKDFIFFKTNLLIAASANDPIKKTLLIQDIVGSIAKISDPIKRSLYVRECADLMNVKEILLIEEVNKLLQRQFKKEGIERQKPEEIDRPIANLRVVKTEDEPQTEGEVTGQDTFQEQDIVRILMTLGHHVFDVSENMSVAEFVLGNLETVLDSFEHPLYRTIVTSAYEHLVAHQFLSTSFYLEHANPEIRKLAIHFATPPYEYSQGWEKRDVYLQTQEMPEQNFTADSVQALKRFTLKKLIRRCEENHRKIQHASNEPEQLMTLLKVQQKLLEVRNNLAKELKTVVFS
ncbi:MAG: DNA primase [Saprospiraceae bacterium]|nr:DNA primase [Saprospiraceae bacterium]